MRYLSLFSGIEAASVAWHPLGWECVGVAEIEPFPCEVLKTRFPGAPNLGDITKVTEEQILALGQIDLIVFGSPCQDLSVAGKRKGFENGTRSSLFFIAMDIVRWAREWCDLRFALWENVPGAFSSNAGADFAAVVGHLGGLEATVPPKGWGTEGCAVGTEAMVEWSTLDAQWFGVAQRRRRVFALADFGDWSSRPPILLEPESLRGDSAPRREAGQSTAHPVAPCLTSSGRGVERGGDTRGQDPVVAVGLQRPVLEPVICAAHGQAGAEITTGYSPTLNCNHEAPYVAYGVATETPCMFCGYLFDQDGLGRYGCPNCEGEGLLAFNSNAQPDEMKFDPHLSAPLTCSQNSAVAIPFDLAQITSSTNRSRAEDGQPASTLAKGSRMHVAVAHVDTMPTLRAVAFQSSQSGVRIGEVHATLDSNNGPRRHNGALVGMQVRRLVPVECERLQGFPDGHTAVLSRGKPAADGPRYKALGNSMAVPVMAWIGRQIDYAFECF